MRKAAAFLVCLALLTGVATAQQPQHAGKVIDDSGGPVAGAHVTLYRLGRFDDGIWKVRRVDRTVSGDDGSFHLSTDKLRHSVSWMDFIVAAKEGLAVGWVHRHWGDASDAGIVLGEPAGLSGRVTDVDGKPIAGATVQSIAYITAESRRCAGVFISAADELTATTDSEGRFTMPRAPRGSSFDFIVSAPGYATIATMPAAYFHLNLLAVAVQKSAPPAWRQEDGEVTLVLPPEARVEGAVVEKGTYMPLSGVRLSLERMTSEHAWRSYVPWERREAVSGDDGRFSIGGMPPGDYRLITTPRVSDERTFMAADMKLTLSAGSVRKLEVQAERAARLDLDVRDAATGAGVSGAHVFHDRPLETIRAHRLVGWTGEDGRVVFFAVPGTYSAFRAFADGYSIPSYMKEMKFAGGRTYSVTIEADRTPDVTGVVLDKDGRGVAGARVRLLPFLYPVDRTPWCTTNEKGQFTLSTRNQRVHLDGPAQSWVVARHEERNLAAAVKIDKLGSPLTLRLSEGTVVTGMVVDENGDGVAGVRARVNFNISEWRSISEVVCTDEDGCYEVRTLPDLVGCSVFAYSGYWINTSGRNSAVATGTHRAQIEPVVLPQGDRRLTGRVVDEDGGPMPGMLVNAGESRTISDADGRFRLEGSGLRQTVSAKGCSRDLIGHVVRITAPVENMTVIVEPLSRTDVREKEPESLVGRKLPDAGHFGLKVPQGKPVVIMFLDKDSRLSRRRVAQLSEKAAGLREKGAAILLVDLSGEGPEATAKWAVQADISLPLTAASGAIDQVKRDWGIRAVPWLILVRGDGRVSAENFSLDELDARLDEIPAM